LVLMRGPVTSTVCGGGSEQKTKKEEEADDSRRRFHLGVLGVLGG
jgi:hypothetical protein